MTLPDGTPSLPTFVINSVGTQARATPTIRDGHLDGLTVLAGSVARLEEVPSYQGTSGQRQREQLKAEGVLEERDGSLVFVRDQPFSTPSGAAAVVMGRTANGNVEWLSEDSRQTLAEWAQEADVSLERLPAGVNAGTGSYIEAASEIGKSFSADPESAGRLPDDKPQFTWPPFFRELAEKVLEYETRQPELVQVLRDAGVSVGDDIGEPLTVMDPFTFFGLILKHKSEAAALAIFARVAQALDLRIPLPTDLTGVPSITPRSALFFGYSDKRQPEDVPTLWALARQALAGELQAEIFEQALRIHKVGLSKLTQGLFWFNPERFLPLNGVNVPYLAAQAVPGAEKVQTLAQYQAILSAASKISDFITLSHVAWQVNRTNVATLNGSQFPFAEFQADAQGYSSDKVKGNLVLDRKYAPLLLELMEGDWTALKPARSPYTGREQLALKVGLAGGVKMDGGAFGRVLMFAEGGFEYVSFPPGLTLEVGLPDGKGDGPRQMLQRSEVWQAVLEALNAPLPEGLQATLTLNNEFGTAPLQPLGPDHEQAAAALLERYRQGLGLSRRLRVGVSLLPEHLQSEDFLELLAQTQSYLDRLTELFDGLMRQVFMLNAGAERAEEVVAASASKVDLTFEPVPGIALNQILYGPPGTGKTYRVVDEALAILDPEVLTSHPGSEGRAARKARFDDLTAQGYISFVTFHQSFGYEDFIEGIKPVMPGGQLSYALKDGLFLKAVRAAGADLPEASLELEAEPAPRAGSDVPPNAQVWQVSIDGHAPVSLVRDLSLERGELRIGTNGKQPKDLSHLGVEELSGRQLLFKESMRVGDMVLLASGLGRISAIGTVTGDYFYDPVSHPSFATDYAHVRPVRWLVKGLNLNLESLLTKPSTSSAALQRVTDLSPEQVLGAAGLPLPDASIPRTDAPDSTKQALRPHVLIIDEINRGNISKIFGELITLLESSKRADAEEQLSATLPISGRLLSVPQSLYVIGTMNTADRSLTLLDAALRRRFVFKPIWPEPQALPVLDIGGTALDLRKFLFAINARIERHLSREQVIGHAYLMGLSTLDDVAGAVRERILPLLEEYFFEDWGRIREILDDAEKPHEAQFIHVTGTGKDIRYGLNPAAFSNIEAFTGVYDRIAEKDFAFES